MVPTLLRRRSPLADARIQRATIDAVRIEDALGGDFDRHLERTGLHPLHATGIEIFQVNVGACATRPARTATSTPGPTASRR